MRVDGVEAEGVDEHVDSCDRYRWYFKELSELTDLPITRVYLF